MDAGGAGGPADSSVARDALTATGDSSAGAEASRGTPDSQVADAALVDGRPGDLAQMMPDAARPDVARPMPDLAAATDTALPEDAVAAGPLDDEFNGSSLSPSWTMLNGSQFTYQVTGGTLNMRPTQYCVWFEGDEGPAFIKSVTGDFKVTTSVKARKASNPTLPAPRDFQFAGIIARDPASATSNMENYVFTVMGDRGGYLTNETKNTIDNSSNVQGPDTGRTHADAELRICRIGQIFRLYERPIGGTAWTLAVMYDRAPKPLPATLQVGPIAYTFTRTPDLVGEFNYIRFAPVGSVADCTTD